MIRKFINRISKRMRAKMDEYRLLAAFYLNEHKFCELNILKAGCTSKSTEIHHRKGRGKYLLDMSTYSATCRNCHDYVHRHPAEAYENGWMEKRV